MIRSAGVLAVVACVVLLVVLLFNTHSAEVVGKVVMTGRYGPNRESDDDEGIVFVRFLGPNEPMERLNKAGIIEASKSEGEKFDTIWGLFTTLEVAGAARPEDELDIRSRRLTLGIGEYSRHWTKVRSEIRRGPERLVFSGPENMKFVMMFGLIPAAPILLWGLAAGIAGVAEHQARRRRGPSTTPNRR